MKKIEIAEDKFCGSHGIIKGNADTCPLCGQTLNISISYTVKRMCDTCGEIVEAPPSYFNSIEHKCPSCEDGILCNIDIIHTAPNFVLDGSWNGKDRSKIIMEKNEQLKRKNAGYSYEQKSIKEKTTKALQDKGIL